MGRVIEGENTPRVGGESNGLDRVAGALSYHGTGTLPPIPMVSDSGDFIELGVVITIVGRHRLDPLEGPRSIIEKDDAGERVDHVGIDLAFLVDCDALDLGFNGASLTVKMVPPHAITDGDLFRTDYKEATVREEMQIHR